MSDISDKEERLLKIEQSIINKIENKATKIKEDVESKIDKITDKIISKAEHTLTNEDRRMEALRLQEQRRQEALRQQEQRRQEALRLQEQRRYDALRRREEEIKRRNEVQRQRMNMTPQQLFELKKHNAKSSLRSHITSFVSVNLFFMALWIIFGRLHPVVGIVFGVLFATIFFGWGIGLVSHIMASKDNIKRLEIMYKNEMETGGFNLSGTSTMGVSGNTVAYFSDYDINMLGEPYSTYVRETKDLASSMMTQINESKNVDKDLIEQIKSSLIHYAEKIYYLSRRGQFLEQAIDYCNDKSVEENKSSIEESLKNDKLDDLTKKEYENALRLLQKQVESYQKLISVRDTIKARLKTSLITLKTLQLDFIRLQYITDESAEGAIKSLNKKTEEIDEYIDLLSDSLKDIDNQI